MRPRGRHPPPRRAIRPLLSGVAWYTSSVLYLLCTHVASTSLVDIVDCRSDPSADQSIWTPLANDPSVYDQVLDHFPHERALEARDDFTFLFRAPSAEYIEKRGSPWNALFSGDGFCFHGYLFARVQKCLSEGCSPQELDALYELYNFPDIYWGVLDFGEAGRFESGILAWLSLPEVRAKYGEKEYGFVRPQFSFVAGSSAGKQSVAGAAGEIAEGPARKKGGPSTGRSPVAGRTQPQRVVLVSTDQRWLDGPRPILGGASAPDEDDEQTRLHAQRRRQREQPLFYDGSGGLLPQFSVHDNKNRKTVSNDNSFFEFDLSALTAHPDPGRNSAHPFALAALGSHFGSNMEPFSMLKELYFREETNTPPLSGGETAPQGRPQPEWRLYGTRYPYPELICREFGLCVRNLLVEEVIGVFVANMYAPQWNLEDITAGLEQAFLQDPFLASGADLYAVTKRECTRGKSSMNHVGIGVGKEGWEGGGRREEGGRWGGGGEEGRGVGERGIRMNHRAAAWEAFRFVTGHGFILVLSADAVVSTGPAGTCYRKCVLLHTTLCRL